jgi:hypothetical protein
MGKQQQKRSPKFKLTVGLEYSGPNCQDQKKEKERKF